MLWARFAARRFARARAAEEDRRAVMLNRSERITEEDLSGLHPASVRSEAAVRALLEAAAAEGSVFHRGLNARVDLEIARLETLADDRLVFRTEGFDRRARRQVFLNFEQGGRPYFFATEPIGAITGDRLEVRMPRSIYCAERRDRVRKTPSAEAGDPSRVEIQSEGHAWVEARVADVSVGGLGVRVPERAALAGEDAESLAIRFVDGDRAGEWARARVRNRAHDERHSGWVRIGLAEGVARAPRPIEVEERSEILGALPGARKPRHTAEEVVQKFASPEIEVVRFLEQGGREVVGLIDSAGPRAGSTAVILQNGWGQTKEALLPLARTLVTTFAAHDEAITVLRFDGVHKRGEGEKDPACMIPGRECHRFVFSQGVSDLRACVDYLHADPAHRPAHIVLVSFSAGAIEARKMVALDAGRTIDGWISVVGAPDLQSMTRSISGGVDFVAGHDRGMRFGLQELLGVEVDIDLLGRDAAALGVLHIEDARRDLAKIDLPVLWLHGAYDAWIDLGRVRDVLSHGRLDERRLQVLPIAHRLENSRQASETFQLIAHEVGRMALDRSLAPVAFEPRDLRARRRVERARRPRPGTDLRAFWRDYLLGRDGSVGIELMTACSDYRALMSDQIESLGLRGGERIADLGCGTGSLIMELARLERRPPDLHVVGFDYVEGALRRARQRFAAARAGDDLSLDLVCADLDVGAGPQAVPATTGGFDVVLASLVLSYVERPAVLLDEILRILRPGGTLVLSSLCRDADISRLYVESLAEMHVSDAGDRLPELAHVPLDRVARNFLNDASRILEFEEQGAFAFWEPEELEELLQRAGFREVESQRSFGTPTQAVVVRARRPAAVLVKSSEQRAYGT
jgi:SAM-dependent methyltransferase